MGALASPHDSDRRSINAFRSLGGVLGSGIGSVAVTPLVKLFGGLQGKGAIIGLKMLELILNCLYHGSYLYCWFIDALFYY